jgi:hypothetical protein
MTDGASIERRRVLGGLDAVVDAAGMSPLGRLMPRNDTC